MVIQPHFTGVVDKDGETLTTGQNKPYQLASGIWVMEVPMDEALTGTSSDGNNGRLIAINEDGLGKFASYTELGGTTPKRGMRLGVTFTTDPDVPDIDAPETVTIPGSTYTKRDVVLVQLTGVTTVTNVGANCAANVVLGVVSTSNILDDGGTKVELAGIKLRTAQGATAGANADVELNFPTVADAQV